MIKGHGWSFPITRLTFHVRKVIGGRIIEGHARSWKVMEGILLTLD